ncbi:MAG: hypothetical protein AABZ14_02975 [Candidatus Margulisiibacteriota bacterium]
MNDYELMATAKEYIASVELINRKGAKVDLFGLEDRLNRELGMDLFVVDMADKVNALLNQPRISQILVAG